MEPILFVSSVLGLLIIIHWSLRNDGRSPSRTVGALAMRGPEGGEPESPLRPARSPPDRRSLARPAPPRPPG